MIHTTIGVYNNWRLLGHQGYKVNGVDSENSGLINHIEYNTKYRFGRALFVDGECVHRGYLTKEDVEEFKSKVLPTIPVMTKDTAPYI